MLERWRPRNFLLPAFSLFALTALEPRPAAAAGVVQQGSQLSIGLNQGATLGQGDLALSFDRDGQEGRPPVRMLMPESALERFSLRFTSSRTITVTNTAPPGLTQAVTSLSDSSGSSSSHYLTDASLTVDTLRLRQRSSFARDGRTLTLTLTLTNLGSKPITGVSYLRAANPDPDLELQGVVGTFDEVVEGEDGPVAVASGAVSGLTLAVGVRGAAASVGFCYRCSDPASPLYDSGGRAEDWDLAAVVTPGDIGPGASVSFTLLYLAAPDAEAAVADWNASGDRDGDGSTGLDGDCDDEDPAIRPGLAELCDGLDQDCDGSIDEGTPCGDDDGDGYSEQAGDCDDADPARRPGAREGTDSDGDGVLEGDGRDNDCDGLIDEGTDRYDDDRDGKSELGGDCDDTAASIHPGATEVPYDGIDQDCTGSDLTDVDGDGFAGGPAGEDCDDGDAETHPDGEERQDGIDNDCDGLVDDPFIRPGDVILTEILYDPEAVADREGEFLELYNASSQPIDLRGWVVANSAGQRHTIDAGRGETRVAPGGFLVLGANLEPASNGQVPVDYGWSGLTLANGVDQITLSLAALEIDGVGWDGGETFPDPAGASIQLNRDCFTAAANDRGDCWCASSRAWTTGSDLGSPGVMNPACPPRPGTDADGDGVVAIEAGGEDCDDGEASIHPGAAEVAYDGIDQDCDGSDLLDGDGDGSAAEAQGGTDCDDGDATVHPGAPEDGGMGSGRGDGRDNDCDGLTDEGTRDHDDDGDGLAEVAGDCDDGEASIHPGAEEVEDGIDNDCDGEVDPHWTDGDGDGVSPAGGDCAEGDPSIYPGAAELPDGVDQDCDGSIDEGTAAVDDDGDGYTERQGDCNDRFSSIHPGGEDLCGDGIDQDCDGTADGACGGCGGCSSNPAGPASGDYSVLVAMLMLPAAGLIRRRRPRACPPPPPS